MMKKAKGVHKSLGRGGGYARVTEVTIKQPVRKTKRPPAANQRRPGGK
jgi:hypothetical protein